MRPSLDCLTIIPPTCASPVCIGIVGSQCATTHHGAEKGTALMAARTSSPLPPLTHDRRSVPNSSANVVDVPLWLYWVQPTPVAGGVMPTRPGEAMGSQALPL